MLMWFADKTGFYCHTATAKNLCKQLKANPKVEACSSAQGAPDESGGNMREAELPGFRLWPLYFSYRRGSSDPASWNASRRSVHDPQTPHGSSSPR